MGYSGLIYAAIVAGWAALLAPRWIRRNEEIERAREADAARGVRVLERRQGRVRGGHVSTSAHMLGRANFSARAALPATSGADDGSTPAHATADHTPARALAGRAAMAPVAPVAAYQVSAATRRRRVLTLFLFVSVTLVAAAVSGVISWVWVTAPAVLLVTFVFLTRRAVVLERRHARAVRLAEMRRERAVAAAPPARRVAVYEPADAPPQDPGSWTPTPVPRPTYLSKAKADSRARRIDLSTSGAWTAGRLSEADPSGSPRAARHQRSQPRRSHDPDEDVDERRRAIGD